MPHPAHVYCAMNVVLDLAYSVHVAARFDPQAGMVELTIGTVEEPDSYVALHGLTAEAAEHLGRQLLEAAVQAREEDAGG